MDPRALLAVLEPHVNGDDVGLIAGLHPPEELGTARSPVTKWRAFILDLGVRATSPLEEFEDEASLVHLAGIVGQVTDFPASLSCHVAVWYWAKQQASREGSAFPPETLAIAFQIASMREGPQNAMLGVRRSGRWDFNLTGEALPPVGTVLLWEQPPTHSAIVTEHGITGYNQVCVFAANVASRGYSHGQPRHVLPEFRTCVTIDERDIIKAAAELL